MAADHSEEEELLEAMDLEDEQLLANLGHHPLLERVQAQLKAQLDARKDRVDEELREQREEEARLAQRREELGVELYGVQQRLAKLQLKLEETTASAEAVAHVRSRAEADLAKFRSGYTKRRDQVAAEDARLEEIRSELDGLNDALREAQRFAEEQQGKVAVARRETYKAESEVTAAEREKERQDEEIDDLGERIKRLSEQLALLEAQTDAQKRDAASAQETLREAAREAEEIETEKRELMSQWRSLLVSLGQRDKALEKCHTSLREQEEAFRSLNAEENNAQKSISRAQDAAATLSEVREREEAAIRFCETTLASVVRQRDALAERHEMLRTSLESADAEEARIENRCAALRKALRELERDAALSQKRRQAAESGREEDESAQVTARKAARNLAKSTKQVLAVVHAKELEKAELENELARAKMGGVEAGARVEALRAQVADAEAELREKEQLIAKYEVEIRQRNDAIEKKSTLVDRLNRKYEAATKDLPEEEHVGPLQATVHNTTKQIAEARSEVEALQRRWLSEQTTLVDVSSDADDKAAQLRELQSQRVLMEQKRLRLERAIAGQQEETAGLRGTMTRMREDMERINSLIARNETLRRKLQDATFAAETDFVEGLREAEAASVAAESEVARLKEAKASLLEDLLEAERQGAVLQKRIALEREMQEALDPTVGEGEVQAMQREIHRMKLRRDALKRDQEKLVKDLERAVQMREDISVRFRARKTGRDPKGGQLTRAGAGKRAAVLRRQIKERRAAAAKLEATLRERREEVAAKEAALQEAEQDVAEQEAEVEAVQAGVNAAVYDKQRAVEALASLEDARVALEAETRRARVLAESGAEEGKESDEEAAAAVEAAEAERRAIREAVQEAQAELPELAEVLDRVHQLTAILQ